MKRYNEYMNEAKKKEKDTEKNWFGISSDPDKQDRGEAKNNGGYQYDDEDYDDDFDDDDFDDDDFDDDDGGVYYSYYNPNYRPGPYDHILNSRGTDEQKIEQFLKYELQRLNYGNRYNRGDDGKNFEKDEEIIYVGSSHGRKEEEGVVRKIRDDGKVVIKFNDNGKLLAASKNRLIKKEDYDKVKEEAVTKYEDAKKDYEERKEKAKKEKEEREKEAALRTKVEPPKPGERWWEKNKKE